MRTDLPGSRGRGRGGTSPAQSLVRSHHRPEPDTGEGGVLRLLPVGLAVAPVESGGAVLAAVTRLTVGGEGAEVPEAVDTVEQGEDEEGDEKPDKEVVSPHVSN